MNELITAALLAIPPACFWIAWEIRGVREQCAAVSASLKDTGKTANAAKTIADIAIRRLDAFERVLKTPGANIHFHQRKEKP